MKSTEYETRVNFILGFELFCFNHVSLYPWTNFILYFSSVKPKQNLEVNGGN